MMTTPRLILVALALAITTGCVYRPYPRPLPPEAPGYVAPTYVPGKPAQSVR